MARISPPPIKVSPTVLYKKSNYVTLAWEEAQQEPNWSPASEGEKQMSDVFCYVVFSRSLVGDAWTEWRSVCRDKKKRRTVVIPGLTPGIKYEFAIQVHSTGGNTSGMSPSTAFLLPADAAVGGRIDLDLTPRATPAKPSALQHLPPEEVVFHNAEQRLGKLVDLCPSIKALGPNVFATVPMGIEHLALEDCLERLRVPQDDVVCAPGLIFLRYKGNLELLHSVTSFSNVYAFVELAADLPLSDKDAALKYFQEGPKQMDWTAALVAWSQTFPDLPSPLGNREGQLPSFRVVCERLGHHPFRSVMVAAEVGASLNDMYRWPANLNWPEMEVSVRLCYNAAILGVRLSKGCGISGRVSLRKDDSERVQKFGTTTLQSCMAHCIARLGRIQPGMVVCDPMAGTGSICLQGVQRWPQACYLAGDVDPECVDNAKANARGSPVDVLHWDVRCLPLRTDSVDVLLSDMPFGQRCGSHNINTKLYKPALWEMARVCRKGSGRAVLLTIEDRLIHQFVGELQEYWSIAAEELVLMGHRCHLFVLERTGKTPPPWPGNRGPKRKAPPPSPSSSSSATSAQRSIQANET
eukprot:GGOE01037442.1.p1 GENE.GGOE01037442.1~~GGOE01037442.1.p1  ORF type:complete len:594 (-),score=133.73 GGOE01037442.1:87-1826(-)